MSLWDDLVTQLRALFGLHPPVVPVVDEEPPQSLRPRVLLLTYNPIIHSEAGRRLVEVLGWRDVDELTRQYIADLHECSRGFLDYHIVQRMEVDAWPVKIDGFSFGIIRRSDQFRQFVAAKCEPFHE